MKIFAKPPRPNFVPLYVKNSKLLMFLKRRFIRNALKNLSKYYLFSYTCIWEHPLGLFCVLLINNKTQLCRAPPNEHSYQVWLMQSCGGGHLGFLAHEIKWHYSCTIWANNVGFFNQSH